MKLAGLKNLFVLLAISLLIPFGVFAQSTTSDPSSTDTTTQAALNSPLGYSASINAGDIVVTLNPEFPGAFQTVSIKLDSDTLNLNRYMIQWLADGQPAQSGIGLRTFQIVSGNYGSTKKITATINIGTAVLQKDILITPQDATLLWEAVNSYVPAFYHGKKMPSRESLITINGIPNFKSVNDSTQLGDAVYLWSRNDNRILGVGGYGKDSITIQQNRLRDSEKITADISGVSNNSTTEKTVVIPTVTPEIHWYVRDEFNYRRLQSIDQGLRVASGDTNLVAEPYFFSIKNGISDLGLTWKVNNNTVYLDPNAPNQELLVHNPGQTGQANFQVAITNPKSFLQSATRAVSLYFQGTTK